MKFKPTQFILVLAAIVILTILTADFFSQSKTASLSPDILYLTQPVHTLQGKVAKIEDKTVWLETALTTPITSPASTEKGQAKEAKKVTYTIMINDQTTINRAPAYIPYLFQTNIQKKEDNSTDNISAGQTITVNTVEDLRTTSSRRATASSINLSSTVATINGTVTGISGEKITVTGILTIPLTTNGLPESETFDIVIKPETEISTQKITPSGAKAQKLSLKDLKEGQNVTIFIDNTNPPYSALTIQAQQFDTPEGLPPAPPPPPSPLR